MSGRCLGLDYAGVEVVLRMRAVADPQAAFADLQRMEKAARQCLNEVRGNG